MGFPSHEEMERVRLQSKANTAVMYLRMAAKALEGSPSPAVTKLLSDIRTFLEIQ